MSISGFDTLPPTVLTYPLNPLSGGLLRVAGTALGATCLQIEPMAFQASLKA